MDANAENATEEIHIHPPPEVSVTRHSPTESVVQALVANQSVLRTLSQAILSVMKQDLPDHAIDRARAEKAAAPVGQSAEYSAVESVDQTGKVQATKRHLPIDVVVIDENTQSKCPCGDKSTAYANSLLRAKNHHSRIPKAGSRGSLHSQLRQLSKFHDFGGQNSR